MPLVASADVVEIDGLYYNLYDTKQAEVTYDPSVPINQGCYSGDVIIPASVSYHDIKYDVTAIGNFTFQYCKNLTSVLIPESVTTIGDGAFEHCQNLPSIDLPDGVTTIGDHAFDGCTAITSLTIPNGVTSIGKFAFWGSALTSIIIPDNVTCIKEYTFYSCIDLKSVTIGKGVKEINKGSFEVCIGLIDVYCLTDDVPVTDNSAFGNDISYRTLHVPEGSIENYKNTEPWSKFGSIVALTDEETSIKSINGGGSSDILRFSLDGKRLNAPQKGLNIIKTPNGQSKKILVK